MSPDSIRDEVTTLEADTLAWDKQGGLLPAVVQDARTLQVLMLGYMDRAALAATLFDGRVTFFSRSKGRLWTKGESSGHVLELVGIETDCDRDTLLVRAIPHGPTCHLQRASCFPEAPSDFLGELDALVARRERERPEGSYTTSLFEAGVETALAAVAQDDAALVGEAADLVFHLMVTLRARGLSLEDVRSELKRRHSR